MKILVRLVIGLVAICVVAGGVYVWFNRNSLLGNPSDGLSFFTPFTVAHPTDNSRYLVFSEVTQDSNKNYQNKTIHFIDPESFNVVKTVTTDISLPTSGQLNYNKTELLLPPASDGSVSVVDLTDGKIHMVAKVTPGVVRSGTQYSWKIASYHWAPQANTIIVVTEETKEPNDCLEKASPFNDSGRCFVSDVNFTQVTLNLDTTARKSSLVTGPDAAPPQADARPVIPNSAKAFLKLCDASVPCRFYSR